MDVSACRKNCSLVPDSHQQIPKLIDLSENTPHKELMNVAALNSAIVYFRNLVTSRVQSENADRSGLLHTMLPNADQLKTVNQFSVSLHRVTKHRWKTYQDGGAEDGEIFSFFHDIFSKKMHV